MKFLKKLKSSNFWVSMISAVVLILQAVFNVEIKTEYLSQIIMGILGVLVMLGIVTDNSSEEVTVKQNVDVDSINTSVSNTLTQIATAFETSLTDFTKQFEEVKQGFNVLNLVGGNSESTESQTADLGNTEVVENAIEQNVNTQMNNEATLTTENAQATPVVENAITVQQNIDDENVL